MYQVLAICILCRELHWIWVLDCRAYDRAAIKFRGIDADINFNLSDYEEDLKQVIADTEYT